MTIARDDITPAVKESGLDDEPGAASMTDDDNAPAAETPDSKPTKAEKLEAKAARLREAQAARERAAAERAGAGAPVTGRLVPWQIATGVLTFLLALTLGLGIPYAISRHDSVTHTSALNTARSQALSTAKSAAVAVASYNYQHLDTDFAKTLSYLTPKFRQSYTPVADKLKPLVQQSKAVATAKVVELGVVSVSTTRVVILAFLDQSVTTSSSTAATINRNRMEITLVKQKGTWLVENLLLK